MKIHEYQGKQILSNFNVPIQDGYIIQKKSEASDIIKKVQNDFHKPKILFTYPLSVEIFFCPPAQKSTFNGPGARIRL